MGGCLFVDMIVLEDWGDFCTRQEPDSYMQFLGQRDNIKSRLIL